MAKNRSEKATPRRTPAQARTRRSARRPVKIRLAAKTPRQSNPAVMADDIPDRVQADYRQLLSQGLTDKKATEQLIQAWKKLLKTKPLQNEFWLALAGTQWQLGRLAPATRKMALAIIDQEVRPKRTGRKDASPDAAASQRHKALVVLRGILTTKQPARREIRRSTAPSSDTEPWPVGAVFAYKLLSGRYVLFHVVACLGDKSAGFWPVFAILDWIGSELPKAAEVLRLPLKPDPHSEEAASPWLVSVLRRHPSDFSEDRIEWLDVQRQPHARHIDRGFAITYWKDKLDEKLRFDFGWE